MNGLDRGLAGLERALEWAAKLALLAMMCLVVADAGGRYIFASPVSGVYEITEFYLMIALIFFSLAMNQREGGNVRADIFYARFPPMVRRWLEVLYLLAALIVFALICYALTRSSVQHVMANRWTTGAVSLPTGPSWGMAALGACILCLRLVLQIARLLADGSQPEQGDAVDRPAAHEGGGS